MIGQTFFRCDTRGAKRREAATARSAGVDPEKQTQTRRPDRRRAENFKKKKTRVGEPSAKMIKMFNAEKFKKIISENNSKFMFMIFEVNFFKNIFLQPLKIMI